MSNDRPNKSTSLRPRLTIHREFSPVLYNTLIELPEALRNEFIARIVQDWSRGLITPRPEGRNGTSDGQRTIGSMAADATTPGAAREGTSAAPTADSPSAAESRSGGVLGERERPGPESLANSEQRSDDEGSPRRTAALFFQSMGDVGDAFDYISQNS